MLQEINTNILQWLNSLTQYPIIEKIVYIFADAPIFFLPIFLITIWLYATKKKDIQTKNTLLFIFYSCIIGIIIALLIQNLVHFERPETALENSGKLLLSHVPDASFPSDHATVSIAFLVSLFFAGYKRVFYIFFPFVVIMNISRVMAGVHWPFDIVAGSLVGIISAYISFYILSKQKLVKTLNDSIIKLAGFFKL